MKAPKGPKPVKKERAPPARSAENEKKVMEMSLEAKKATFDVDNIILKHVWRECYPDYSLVDINRYYHGKAAQVAEILMSNDSRTLLNRQEFMRKADMTEKEIIALIEEVVLRDYRATSKTRKRVLRLSLAANDGDDSDPEGISYFASKLMSLCLNVIV